MHQRTLLHIALGGLLLGGLTPRSAGGHEVPPRVAVTSFVRPEGDVLWLAVRVPLAALRDVDWPIDERGVLDAVAAHPLLRDAAQLWVADYLSVWEGGRALAPPQIAATRLSLPSDRSFATYDEALAHFTGPLLGADAAVAIAQASDLLSGERHGLGAVVDQHEIIAGAVHFGEVQGHRDVK